MVERISYFNGKYVPVSKVYISQYSLWAMQGVCVFEMLRSFNKIHFKLGDHLDRLYKGLKVYRIEPKESIVEMARICEKVTDINRDFFKKDDEFRLKINIGGGNLSIYPSPHTPIVIVDVFPLRWTIKGMGKLFDEGVNAIIPSHRTIDHDLIDQRVKNCNRLHFYLANQDISGYSGENNWALLLDSRGFIAEGTGDNFFIVKNNKIITPKCMNILGGISRDYIRSMVKNNLKYEFIETDINFYDVCNADEAFYSATPFCIMPCVSIQGVKIGNGKVGPCVKYLLALWSKIVGVDIVEQIKKWDINNKDINGITPYMIRKN